MEDYDEIRSPSIGQGPYGLKLDIEPEGVDEGEAERIAWSAFQYSPQDLGVIAIPAKSDLLAAQCKCLGSSPQCRDVAFVGVDEDVVAERVVLVQGYKWGPMYDF